MILTGKGVVVTSWRNRRNEPWGWNLNFVEQRQRSPSAPRLSDCHPCNVLHGWGCSRYKFGQTVEMHFGPVKSLSRRTLKGKGADNPPSSESGLFRWFQWDMVLAFQIWANCGNAFLAAISLSRRALKGKSTYNPPFPESGYLSSIGERACVSNLAIQTVEMHLGTKILNFLWSEYNCFYSFQHGCTRGHPNSRRFHARVFVWCRYIDSQIHIFTCYFSSLKEWWPSDRL